MPEKYTRPHSHERVQAVERMRRVKREEGEALAAGLLWDFRSRNSHFGPVPFA